MISPSSSTNHDDGQDMTEDEVNKMVQEALQRARRAMMSRSTRMPETNDSNGSSHNSDEENFVSGAESGSNIGASAETSEEESKPLCDTSENFTNDYKLDISKINKIDEMYREALVSDEGNDVVLFDIDSDKLIDGHSMEETTCSNKSSSGCGSYHSVGSGNDISLDRKINYTELLSDVEDEEITNLLTASDAADKEFEDIRKNSFDDEEHSILKEMTANDLKISLLGDLENKEISEYDSYQDYLDVNNSEDKKCSDSLENKNFSETYTGTVEESDSNENKFWQLNISELVENEENNEKPEYAISEVDSNDEIDNNAIIQMAEKEAKEALLVAAKYKAEVNDIKTEEEGETSYLTTDPDEKSWDRPGETKELVAEVAKVTEKVNRLVIDTKDRTTPYDHNEEEMTAPLLSNKKVFDEISDSLGSENTMKTDNKTNQDVNDTNYDEISDIDQNSIPDHSNVEFVCNDIMAEDSNEVNDESTEISLEEGATKDDTDENNTEEDFFDKYTLQMNALEEKVLEEFGYNKTDMNFETHDKINDTSIGNENDNSEEANVPDNWKSIFVENSYETLEEMKVKVAELDVMDIPSASFGGSIDNKEIAMSGISSINYENSSVMEDEDEQLKLLALTCTTDKMSNLSQKADEMQHNEETKDDENQVFVADDSEEKNRSQQTSLLTEEMTASSEFSEEILTEIDNEMEVSSPNGLCPSSDAVKDGGEEKEPSSTIHPSTPPKQNVDAPGMTINEPVTPEMFYSDNSSSYYTQSTHPLKLPEKINSTKIRHVELRNSYPLPPPAVRPRPPDEILKEHQKVFYPVFNKWRKPSAQLSELLCAAKGDSVARRSNACGAFKVLAACKENQKRLARTSGVLEALIFAANQSPISHDADNAFDARTRAVQTILYLSTPISSRTLIMSQAGLAECLVKVISDDYGEARVNACSVLATLAKTPENRYPMVETQNLVEIVSEVVSGRRKFERRDDLQKYHMALDDCSSVDSSTYDGSSFTDDNDSFSQDSRSQASSSSLQEVNGISRKVEYSERDVNETSCQLNKDESNQEQVYDSRPIHMQRYNEYLDAARLNSCAILTHLVKFCPVSPILCKKKIFVETMITASLESTSPVHTRCVEILCHLTRFQSNNTFLARKKDLVETLISCGRSKEPEDRVWALRSLQNLASDSKSRLRLATTSLLTLLSAAAMSKDKEEVFAAVATLLNLSTEPGTIIPLTNTKSVLATLVHLAHNTNSPFKVRRMACSTLSNLSLWLQTLAGKGTVPEGVDQVLLPSNEASSWQRWD